MCRAAIGCPAHNQQCFATTGNSRMDDDVKLADKFEETNKPAHPREGRVRLLQSMITARVITTIRRLHRPTHPYIVVMTLAVIMGGGSWAGAVIMLTTPRTYCKNPTRTQYSP